MELGMGDGERERGGGVEGVIGHREEKKNLEGERES